VSTGDGNRGGEHPENRAKMESMVGQLIEGGHGSGDARRIARECALRQDGDRPGGAQQRDITDADKTRARDRANRTDWT